MKKIMIIGPGKPEILKQIKDMDVDVEIVDSEDLADLVINAAEEPLLPFEFSAMTHHVMDYPDPKKFKEPKTYRSKKDRRNHR